ncbi:FxsA family protein [Solirhodobacter olei]|uniref:FxsA family protein n=1 Tax=Solirhodobacter olei TaxID=2493082 RepID=UPI000FD880D4|nr:FxsA family protein [Solirhodobacter olei]
MPILALLVLLPMIEIGLFVTLGAWIGLWGTLGIVLASALLGASVIRRQGFVTMLEVREALQMRRDPGPKLADGALTVLAGVLLIVPGFFTDAVGLLLLVPPLRAAVIAWGGRNMRLRGMVIQSGPQSRTQGDTRHADASADTIDGDFFEVDPSKRPTHRPSGWTRH